MRRAKKWLQDRVFRSLGRDIITAKVGDGGAVLFSPNDYIGQKILRTGNFQRNHLTRAIGLLQSELAGRNVFVDIGANIGTHTLYSAETGAFGRYVCV